VLTRGKGWWVPAASLLKKNKKDQKAGAVLRLMSAEKKFGDATHSVVGKTGRC
jgi:hypothetical protein